ncbi:MAG: hypothetical protein P8R42_05465 [Candidatus Binatia bacterium]|nr:hypothetical protein [Candidatus Binatia bacterium]
MRFPLRPGLLAAVMIVALGCGDGSTEQTSSEPSSSGPTADRSEEITGGNGPFIGAATAAGDDGYEEHEYVASGEATAYREAEPLTADGRTSRSPWAPNSSASPPISPG